MIGAVKTGSHEIIHAGISDDEILDRGPLRVEHLTEQYASVADDNAAGFENQGARQAIECLQHGLSVFSGVRRGFLVISDAEPPAQVEVADRDVHLFQTFDERSQPLQSIHKRGNLRKLAADVAVYSQDFDSLQMACLLISFDGGVEVDSELVLLQPRGYIGVSLRVDIRVNPEGDGGLTAEYSGTRIDGFQLLGGFDVEHQDALPEGVVDFGLGFAHPGIDNPVSGYTSPAGSEQLAARDNVRAPPKRSDEA